MKHKQQCLPEYLTEEQVASLFRAFGVFFRIPVQPVRSLPLKRTIGVPFTQVPSSCSSITGARSPVKVRFLPPIIFPSSLPLTYRIS